ncbi:MAG: hypothetical protein AB4426_27355 [Xenococcaceae cyanobacterium]
MSEEHQEQPTPVNRIPPETGVAQSRDDLDKETGRQGDEETGRQGFRKKIQNQEQSSETAQSTGNSQSFSQAETIELLRGTIRRLEEILDKLKAESVENLLPKASVETLVASTSELAASLEKAELQRATPTPEVTQEEAIAPTATTAIETDTPLPTSEVPEDTATATPVPEVTEEIIPVEEAEEELVAQPSWLDRVLGSFSNLQAGWNGILEKIRSLLPAFLSEKLSNWALMGILTGIVVVLLLTSVLLLPQESREVAQEVETPPELKAPEEPQPVENAPPPQPELTPEQSLIAAIQNQVAEITSQYEEELILSIEANFLDSRLIVTVSDDWYELGDSQQDQLANEMLDRSRKLDFRRLEITASEGPLLARSPVVGENMVILQRNSI